MLYLTLEIIVGSGYLAHYQICPVGTVGGEVIVGSQVALSVKGKAHPVRAVQVIVAVEEAALTVDLPGESSGDVVLIDAGVTVDIVLLSGQAAQSVIDVGTGLHRSTTGGVGYLFSGEAAVAVIEVFHALAVAIGGLFQTAVIGVIAVVHQLTGVVDADTLLCGFVQGNDSGYILIFRKRTEPSPVPPQVKLTAIAVNLKRIAALIVEKSRKDSASKATILRIGVFLPQFVKTYSRQGT